APCLKIPLGPSGGYHLPCALESRARSIEGFSDAGLLFARPGAWIEAARPSPLRRVRRRTGTLADRADADIAEIDVPMLEVARPIAAAGEGRADGGRHVGF